MKIHKINGGALCDFFVNHRKKVWTFRFLSVFCSRGDDYVKVQNTFLHPDRTVCSRSYRMYRLFNPCRNRRPYMAGAVGGSPDRFNRGGNSDKKTGPTVERTEKTEKEQPEEETNAAVDSVQMDPPCPDTATERFNRNLRRVGGSAAANAGAFRVGSACAATGAGTRQTGAIVDTAGGRTGRTRETLRILSGGTALPSCRSLSFGNIGGKHTTYRRAFRSGDDESKRRRLRNQAFHSLLKRLKAIHRRIATASSEKPLPTQKAIGKRGSPSNGRNRWNSDGRSGIWVHQGSGRRVWTGRSAD